MIGGRGGSRGRIGLVGLVGLLALVEVGCGLYTVKPGRVRPGLETVAVPYFENRSDEPDIEVEFTEAVIEGLIADRTLRVVEEDVSDALVLGTIRGYKFQEVFFGEDRQAEEYQITVSMEVSLVERATNETIAGPRSITGRGSYLLSEGLTGEQQARADAATQLVEGILNLVVEEW